MDVVVVAHTHWDREWYHTVGRFRQRLVALVDTLIDEPDGGPFLLDGQAITLDDYLEVRPDREGALAEALGAGRLEAGPWYVLADELIPSGESLVRNLLVGREILARLGAAPPPVLYCPDAFGHPAALPALAAGFGFDLVVVWRGYGGQRWPAGDTAWWTAPSGERALLHHLPPSGYEFGSTLPTRSDEAAARWAEMRAVLAARVAVGVTLLPSGADHHARQHGLGEAIAALRASAAPDDEVRRGSLASFANAIIARAQDVVLPQVRGELRDSYGYTWTLQGTFAARAHQKRQAARRDRELRWDVEPWAALALMRDVDLRPSLGAAWRTLLACHPHDTLCGCSIDDVARAMDDRLRDARAQAAGLRTDAIAALLNADADALRGRRERWQPSLVVRNAIPRPRGGVVEVELLSTIADEPVGPGSSRGARAALVSARAAAAAPPPSIDGIPVVQWITADVKRDRVESPRHYPDNDLVRRWRGVAWIPPLPAAGLRCFAIRTSGDAGELAADNHGAPSRPANAQLDGTTIHLRNALLHVEIDEAGRMRLTTADGAHAIAGLIDFEAQGDAGDLYTTSLRGPVHRDWRVRRRTIIAAGALRAVVELAMTMTLPRSRRRGAGTVRQPLLVRLTLDADAPFLRIEVRGRNRARDHRLRVVFRTGIAAPVVTADAAFGPIVRAPIVVDDASRAMETPPPTAPLHRYCSLRAQGRGVTLISDGLAEYEATDDGELSVTLVRAVGTLSRATLPERPGHAGWPSPTPLAQCQHPFAAAFAIAPHPAALDDAAAVVFAEHMAEDVLTPPRGETWRAVPAVPPAVHGPALAGEGLVASAIKPTAHGDGLVLRCVNVLGREVEGSWTVEQARAAWTARLDETVGERLPIEDGGVIRLRVPPRGIVTIVVR